MERADIANGEGDPEDRDRRPPDRSQRDDETIPRDQDPEDQDGKLPPLGQELEAD